MLQDSGIPRRMGRPPRGLIRTTVWLPEWLGKRLDAVLEGKEKRADVIRAAIERELQRREGASHKVPKSGKPGSHKDPSS
jgi:hypothetical protein